MVSIRPCAISDLMTSAPRIAIRLASSCTVIASGIITSRTIFCGSVRACAARFRALGAPHRSERANALFILVGERARDRQLAFAALGLVAVGRRLLRRGRARPRFLGLASLLPLLLLRARPSGGRASALARRVPRRPAISGFSGSAALLGSGPATGVGAWSALGARLFELALGGFLGFALGLGLTLGGEPCFFLGAPCGFLGLGALLRFGLGNRASPSALDRATFSSSVSSRSTWPRCGVGFGLFDDCRLCLGLRLGDRLLRLGRLGPWPGSGFSGATTRLRFVSTTTVFERPWLKL